MAKNKFGDVYEVAPESKEEKVTKTPSLRELFNQLSKEEQELVTHFFNLHNAAIFLYMQQMSEASRKYTDYCVSLSQEKSSQEELVN